jgi:hypothetical protein
MPAINLPNGESAILYSNSEISERKNRMITRAFMKAAGSASKLTESGFVEEDPTTWSVFGDMPEEDLDNLNGYQAALIVGMVKSWTLGDVPTIDSALDLPKALFDQLSSACGEEFNNRLDVSPNTDPKAPTAD